MSVQMRVAVFNAAVMVAFVVSTAFLGPLGMLVSALVSCTAMIANHYRLQRKGQQ